jgi:hypothetical protein
MDMNLYVLHWTAVPLAAMTIAGAALIVLGIHRQFQGLCRSSQDDRSLRWALGGFRMMVIGLGLVGAAAGWHYQITWLLVLSLAFAGEETFESSLMIGALPHSTKRDCGSSRSPAITVAS